VNSRASRTLGLVLRRGLTALVCTVLAVGGLSAVSVAARADTPAPAPSTNPAPAPDNPDSGPPSTDSPPSQPADEPPDESEASTQARESGHSVEVTGAATETDQVVAEPDGSFTATTSTKPTRIRRGSVWVPVDTTLHVNAGGSVSPAATSAPLTFSGGGSTAPMVTIGGAGQALSFTWSAGSLPTPTISGSTAVYANVLPGVDLRLTAHVDSYSEVLAIHDATAAANPTLANLNLGVTGDGLTVAASGDGQLSATDSSSAEVFHGSTPLVWDSSADPSTGATPTADDPGSGKVSQVAVHMFTPGATTGGVTPHADSGVRLTLTPAAGALTGTGVTYPVFFDPGMTGKKQHYATVTSSGWHYYDDTSQTARVGDCGWPGCNGIGVARSFYAVDTRAFTGRATTAKVSSATLAILERHSANNCTAQPVNLYQAGAFDKNTAWPGPLGAGIQSVSSAAGDSCPTAPPNNVIFSGTNLVNYLQSGANADRALTYFALAAPDEGQKLQWKQFDTDATLTVHFNFPPSVPTGLGVAGSVNCNGHVYTSAAFPTLNASAVDNNPSPLQLALWYELFPADSATRAAANTTGVKITSGHLGQWPVNRSGGLGNADWRFRVHSENLPGDAPHLSSAVSGLFNFTSRATPPAQAPWIGSYEYAGGNYWGPPAGTPGTFMLSANGSAHVIGFSYTWAGAGTEPALANTTCNYNQTVGNGGYIAATSGNASLAVPTTLPPGLHTLRVRAFDEAHNLSPESTAYTFYVAPNFGVTSTRLEISDGSKVALSQPTGQNLTLSAPSGNDPHFWSGGNIELFPATAKDQSLSMTFSTPIGTGGVPLEADYALGIKTNLASNYGIASFVLDGIPLADSLDTYWASNATSYRPLGGTHLTAGQHTLVMTVTGKNAASSAYNIGLDYLMLVPFNNVTTASFGAAMNNHGIAVDGTGTADLDLNGNTALSSTALAGLGWAPGAKVTIGGAQFTMPTPNPTTGNDNVIAAGQIIPMDATQQVHASAIGMLVVATCGATPGNVKGTVTYAPDGSPGSHSTSSNAAYVAVPDWGVGPSTAAAAVLDHRLTGTAVDSAVKPRVYALFLPADPTKTLQSVTLPILGTTFMPGSCSRALHILSMAPRPVAAGWIGTWATTIQSATTTPVGGAGLANQTLRLVVHPTVTGPTARVRVSNSYVNVPVTIDAATIAAQSTGAGTLAAPAALTFCAATGQAAGCGVRAITLPAGGEAYSDPVAFPATTGGSGNLAVSLHLPTAVAAAPVHNAGNTTNYLASGNSTADATGTPYATTTTASYYLNAVDVSTTDPSKGTIAVLGDPTSAAGPAGGTYQPTWVDDLPAKLGAALPGGLVNASLNDSTPTGYWRGGEVGNTLNLSVLDEPNLRTVIVAVGAQDVLQGSTVDTIRSNITNIALNGSSAYGIAHYYRATGGQVEQVHVILATIPPLGLASTDTREKVRTDLNAAIRANPSDLGADEFIDYDAAVRDPAHPSNINPTYLTGGSPNATYYNAFAQALADATATFPPGAQL
jgi:hypothetical protein